ncbi:alanine aminotransferase 1-like isoform X3 [Corvus moneduloides]|uniref:alanine aminotransferase 1-like isoform X3 n=1 Tax=Corvus moneduloides TaxID=1196302 RepID=UPI0013646C1C|nr:alanine aminotransferase 1-like isoform X3 [Corvus moneduloides]
MAQAVTAAVAKRQGETALPKDPDPDPAPAMAALGTSGGTGVPPAPVTPRWDGGGGIEEELAPPVPDVTQCHPEDAEGRQAPAFLRQVAAICAYPALLEHEDIPESAKEHARRILRELMGGSPGAYNLEYVTGAVAERAARFLAHRDRGIACDPANIVPCAGTAAAVVDVLSLVVCPGSALPTGVLVPVPGPPLCAAAAGLAGAVPVPYPLDESRGWAVDVAALRREVREARSRCHPRVLWVVNPGDPTGHVLSRPDMESIVRLAAEEPLLLLADEVHQERAFSPERPFLSFKRVLAELGAPLATSVQLVSFYSLSKGIGGGGFRAGFLELVNIERSVLRGFYTWGLSVYPPILGQVMLDVAMEPPGHRDPASAAMEEHRRDLCRDLAANARRLQEELGRAPGIRCQPLAGGPRAFPRIRIPPRARSQARPLRPLRRRWAWSPTSSSAGGCRRPRGWWWPRGATSGWGGTAATWGCPCCCRRRRWSERCCSSAASTPNSCGNSPDLEFPPIPSIP